MKVDGGNEQIPNLAFLRSFNFLWHIIARNMANKSLNWIPIIPLQSTQNYVWIVGHCGQLLVFIRLALLLHCHPFAVFAGLFRIQT